MAKFIQIGSTAFAVDKITDISFTDNQVAIFFGPVETEGHIQIVFTTDYYDLFMYWWETEADVYKVTIPQQQQDCPACQDGEGLGPEHLETCEQYVPF